MPLCAVPGAAVSLSCLHDDLLAPVLVCLNPRSKASARLVCKTFRDVVDGLVDSITLNPDQILNWRIPRSFRALRELRFVLTSHNRTVDPDSLELALTVFLQDARWLPPHSIEVAGLRSRTRRFLEALQHFKGLHRLVLPHCLITPDNYQHLHALKELLHLDLSGSVFWDTAITLLSALVNLTALTHLNLSDTPVQDTLFPVCAGLKDLHELLVNSTAMTGAGLTALQGLEQLTLLEMDNWQQLTMPGVSALASLTRLRNLSLTSDPHSELQDDTQLAAISTLRGLTRFRSEFWHIEQETTALLALPELQELFVSGVTLQAHEQATGCGLTSATFCNLAFPGREDMRLLPLQGLVALRVDQGLLERHVRDFMLQTQLRELSLAVWGRLPEALWLRLLDSLPLLERLEVGTALELGDAALQRVAALPHLRHLWLSFWPKVSQQGLQALQQCTGLHSLSLQLMDVPVTQLAALLEALPLLSSASIRALRHLDAPGHAVLKAYIRARHEERWRKGLRQQEQETQTQQGEQEEDAPCTRPQKRARSSAAAAGSMGKQHAEGPSSSARSPSRLLPSDASTRDSGAAASAAAGAAAAAPSASRLLLDVETRRQQARVQSFQRRAQEARRFALEATAHAAQMAVLQAPQGVAAGAPPGAVQEAPPGAQQQVQEIQQAQQAMPVALQQALDAQQQMQQAQQEMQDALQEVQQQVQDAQQAQHVQQQVQQVLQQVQQAQQQVQAAVQAHEQMAREAQQALQAAEAQLQQALQAQQQHLAATNMPAPPPAAPPPAPAAAAPAAAALPTGELQLEVLPHSEVRHRSRWTDLMVDNGSMPASFEGTDDSVDQVMEGLGAGHWGVADLFLALQGLEWDQGEGEEDGEESEGGESGEEGEEEGEDGGEAGGEAGG